MAKFGVTCREVSIYTITVEAESFEDAVAEVEGMDNTSPTPEQIQSGEWGIESVTNLETMKTRLYCDGIEEEDDG
ncbi:hypothetical protein DFAR_3060038 [Desulfarculales bacterium]